MGPVNVKSARSTNCYVFNVCICVCIRFVVLSSFFLFFLFYFLFLPHLNNNRNDNRFLLFLLFSGTSLSTGSVCTAILFSFCTYNEILYLETKNEVGFVPSSSSSHLQAGNLPCGRTCSSL